MKRKSASYNVESEGGMGKLEGRERCSVGNKYTATPAIVRYGTMYPPWCVRPEPGISVIRAWSSTSTSVVPHLLSSNLP